MIQSFNLRNNFPDRKLDSTNKLKNQTEQLDETMSEVNTEDMVKERKQVEWKKMIQTLTKPMKIPIYEQQKTTGLTKKTSDDSSKSNNSQSLVYCIPEFRNMKMDSKPNVTSLVELLKSALDNTQIDSNSLVSVSNAKTKTESQSMVLTPP